MKKRMIIALFVLVTLVCGTAFARTRCTNCNGTGKQQCTHCKNSLKGRGHESCSTCHGYGKIIIQYYPKVEETCPDCNGKGYQDCSYCNGTLKEDCTSCKGVGYFYDYDEDDYDVNIYYYEQWNY